MNRVTASLVLFAVCRVGIHAEEASPADTLPDHALVRFGSVGFMHAESTRAVLWTADGKHLMTAGNDGSIRLWSTATWKESKRFEVPKDLRDLVLTPDQKTVVGQSNDSIYVWEFATGALQRKFKAVFNTVTLAISPDGTLAAAGGQGDSAVFEIATGKQVHKLAMGKDDLVEKAFFLPKGTIVVGALDSGKVVYWDVKTGEVMTSNAASKSEMLGAALSPDGHTLATAGGDGVVTFWEAGTDKKLGETKVAKGNVVLEFSPDGKTLACGDRNIGGGGWGQPMFVLLDVETRAATKSIAATNRDIVTNVTWSPDGKLLGFLNSGRARVWDIAADKEVLAGDGHRGHVLAVAISPDAKRVVTGGEDKTVRIWDAATGKPEAILRGHAWAVGSLIFRKNGALLVSGAVPADDSFRRGVKPVKDATLRVWEVASGKELRQLGDYSSWVRSMAPAADDLGVYVSSGESPIRSWNADTGESAGDIETGKRSPQHIAASKDGRWLAFSDDMTAMDVTLWDLKAGSVAQVLKVRGSGTESLDFSPDGELLAERKGDKTVRFWETATGKQRSTLRISPKFGPWSAAFDPSGKFFALGTGGGTVSICSVSNGKVVLELSGHLGPIQCVTWSSDGKRLATTGYDSTAILWDVSSLTEGGK